MKKIMALMLIVVMMAAMTACGQKEDANATISYVLPDGFTESPDSPGMYLSPEYPDDTSNIYIQSADNDPIGIGYTEEMVADQIELTYAAQGYDVDVNLVEFTKGKLDGYDTLLIHITYMIYDVEVEQIEYLIQIGKTTHALVYTTTPDSDYSALFRENIDSVTIVK